MSKRWVYYELYEDTWATMKGFISLGELGKIFYMFWNSIDQEILGQCGMGFEKSFKSYSNN
jgi:hypothetical protein